MIKIGPSGSDNEFTLKGHKSTLEMPAYVKEAGLDCFEYSFGQGVRLSEKTALQIGAEFTKEGIEISVHAPYFVNFANPDEEKIIGSFKYMTDSLIALSRLGGQRCVVHPGSPLKADRSVAVSRMNDNLKRFAEHYREMGFENMFVCLETMGKVNQLGSIDEIIDAVNIDPIYIPCYDFGHINAREQGYLSIKEHYEGLIKKTIDGMAWEKAKNMHVHFSKIQYGKSGEIRHLTFEDEIYGPDFEPMIDVFVKYGMTPYIVCESAGTQTKDAQQIKNYYKRVISF